MKDAQVEVPLVNTFLLGRSSCKVIVNRNCLLWELEDSPNNRTIIPLKQLIAVKPCYCKKESKRLVCDCIIEDYNGSSVASTSSSSSTRSSPCLRTSQDKPCVIRAYHAVPVGKYNWKVTFVSFQLSPDADIDGLQNWLGQVRALLDELRRPKRLLVFINPYGGKRKAPSIYQEKVWPILLLAGCDINCTVTQRANHARDVLENLDMPIKDFDGVICVGGDGMFAELLNGIIIRAQRETEVEVDSTESLLTRPSMPLGVIPAGSTDALAFGATGCNDPVTSVVHVILGNKVNIDVCAIHSSREDGKLLRYSTSFLGYGFFGDTMKASEKNRWMGPSRYDWAGFKKILGNKVYSGEIRMHVSTVDGSPKEGSICTEQCPLCAKASLRTKYMQTMAKVDEGTACMKIRGRFIAINSATMSCRCKMSKKGMSPNAHLGNGCSDLIIVSKCSRVNYIRYMMRTAFLPKSPFDLNYVDVYRVKEFEFTPIVNPNGSSKSYRLSNASVWNCDGEIITEPAIHVKVHCQLVTVFGSGVENRDLGDTQMKYLHKKMEHNEQGKLNSKKQSNKPNGPREKYIVNPDP